MALARTLRELARQIDQGLDGLADFPKERNDGI
jgi:hypothetical protein